MKEELILSFDAEDKVSTSKSDVQKFVEVMKSNNQYMTYPFIAREVYGKEKVDKKNVAFYVKKLRGYAYLKGSLILMQEGFSISVMTEKDGKTHKAIKIAERGNPDDLERVIKSTKSYEKKSATVGYKYGLMDRNLLLLDSE